MAKPKSRAKSSHGGSRKGAGRKASSPKTIEKRIGYTKADASAAADQVLLEFLPRSLQNLIVLANGGYERVELEFTLPPTPEVEGVEFESEPVLTKRKVSYAEPDRAANQYLVDRVLGKPRQSVEVDAKVAVSEDVMERARRIREKRAESIGQ